MGITRVVGLQLLAPGLREQRPCQHHVQADVADHHGLLGGPGHTDQCYQNRRHRRRPNPASPSPQGPPPKAAHCPRVRGCRHGRACAMPAWASAKRRLSGWGRPGASWEGVASRSRPGRGLAVSAGRARSSFQCWPGAVLITSRMAGWWTKSSATPSASVATAPARSMATGPPCRAPWPRSPPGRGRGGHGRHPEVDQACDHCCNQFHPHSATTPLGRAARCRRRRAAPCGAA